MAMDSGRFDLSACRPRSPQPFPYSMNTGRNLFVHPLTFLVLFLIFSNQPALPSTTEADSSLVVARWRVEAFSTIRQGLCCWATGPDGVLRLEVTPPREDRASIPSLESVLAWQGDGWTLILGEPGQGTLNRWHQEWRNSPPGLEDWIRGVLGRFPVVDPDRPEATEIALQWEAPRLVLDEGSSTDFGKGRNAFRRRMIRRGRGRGAEEEIVRLDFRIPQVASGVNGSWPTGTVMNLSSSRRPGTLRLEILDRPGIGVLPVEAFLPLWPLIEFVSPEGTFQGTTSGLEGY